MKLSVKLLSGLTLIALVAVAVVGLSHSASAAADGKVYVTNKASKLTTEGTGKPSGRTTASTVYGTYASYASTGTTARDIVADSDTFIVTVIDSDLNTTSTVTDDRGSNHYPLNDDWNSGGKVSDIIGSGFSSAGSKVHVTLADASKPIVGSASDIVLRNANGTVITSGNSSGTGMISVGIVYAGNGTAAPILSLQRNFGTSGSVATGIEIAYPTSAVQYVPVNIKSVVDPAGATVLTLTETGRNTGRFEGEVRIEEHRTTGGQPLANGVSGDAGVTARIPAVSGPVTVTYTDAATSGTATNVKRTATISIDTTVPVASISSPASGSETQNRLPSFAGTVTDNESGLDKSTFLLRIDSTDDATNANLVIPAGANRGAMAYPGTGTVAGLTLLGKTASISLTGYSDGATSIPFTYNESASLPAGVTTVDHIVDFQVQVADLAGNYGYSDSSSTKGNDGTGRHGNQPHNIKIDQVLPTISSVETGKAWDATLATPAEKSNVVDSLVVEFDGNVNADSIQPTDFEVTLSGSGGTFVPAAVTVNKKDVYLDLDSDIPTNNTPTVKLVGTVEDKAGNSTAAGSKKALDKLAPTLTVTLSGGSGTGTDGEAADKLTKDKMTVTVSSDENLQSAPALSVTDLDTALAASSSHGNVASSVAMVAQGGNTWKYTVGKGASADGKRAVTVVASDSAGNSKTVGKTSGTYAADYTLDKSLATPNSTPANNGTTTESFPYLVTNYESASEKHSVSITSAKLGTADVTGDVVASANNKVFFYQPTEALENKEHTYEVKAKDAAGNTKTTTVKFTKKDRTDYVIALFAGWNAVSIPSDPIDSSIGSALSNTGIKQVIGYDATTPSQPWRIASKVDDGDYTSQTTPGLDNITAGNGYWIESGNFEDQTVALEGPTGPGDPRPPLVSIPTGNGWNFVGAVDQSRVQTQKGSGGAQLQRTQDDGTTAINLTQTLYFSNVNNDRVYVYDTVRSKFLELTTNDPINVGMGMWVHVSPQANGQLPPIVP